MSPTKTTKNATPKKGRKPASAPKWQPVFLQELANTGNVSAAANKAEIDRATAYAYRSEAQAEKPNPGAITFAKGWDAALEVAIDALELEARRRAVEGVEEPVGWYKGIAGGTVQRYSDTLLIVLLKAHRPEKYRENIHQEMTGKDGGPIELVDVRARLLSRFAETDAEAASPGVPGKPAAG